MKKYRMIFATILMSINIYAMYDFKELDTKAWRIAKLFYKYPDGYGQDDESKKEKKCQVDIFLQNTDLINGLVNANLQSLQKLETEKEISWASFFNFVEKENCETKCKRQLREISEKLILEVLSDHLRNKAEEYFIFSSVNKFKKIACARNNLNKEDFVESEIKKTFSSLLHMDNCFESDKEIKYLPFIKDDVLKKQRNVLLIAERMYYYLNDIMKEDYWEIIEKERYVATKGIKTDVANFKLWLQLTLARLSSKEGCDFVNELCCLLSYFDLTEQDEKDNRSKKNSSFLPIEVIMRMKQFNVEYDYSFIVGLLRSKREDEPLIKLDEKKMKLWQNAPDVLKRDKNITSLKIDIADNPRGTLRKIGDSLLVHVPLMVSLFLPDITMYYMKDVLSNFVGDKKRAMVDIFVSSMLINGMLVRFVFPLLDNLHSDVAWLKVFFDNKVRKNIKQGLGFSIINAFQWMCAYLANLLISYKIFRFEVAGFFVHCVRIPLYLLAAWCLNWQKPIDRGAPDFQNGSRSYTLGDLKEV